MQKTGKPQTTKAPTSAKKKRKRRAPVWVRILRSLVIALVFTGVATVGITYALTLSTFDPSKLQDAATNPTIVYDRFGHVAFTIEPTGIRRVSLRQIPKYLQDGLIAVEDVRFYHNTGIDLRSAARSLINDILHRNQLQGASTITEQLAKIVYLKDDRSLRYKLQQVILAVQIDRYFSKNQILDMYFNFVNFNGATPGIENASQIYFQKDVSKLDLAQSALLAGLPQAPTEYDPFLHPNAALARRNIVLAQMAKYGYITPALAAQTEKLPLELATSEGPISDGVPPQYAYYRDYLYAEADQVGFGSTVLQQGGYKVYTDLDPQLQQATYNQFEQSTFFPPNQDGQEAQAGAAFVNPKTGGIEALMGGRPNSYVYQGFDYASQARRSPGSSIKPLVVYGPAIDTGRYNANSLLYDGVFNVGNYSPHDWAYHPTIDNKVTMREALAMSWNIPAVWLLQQIGIGTGLDFAERAGLHFETQDFSHLDVALGDIHPGTNPLEMADAYTSFDNYGQRIPSHAIDRIVNSNGAIVYQFTPIPVQVMKPSTAAQMVALLHNNVTNGIAAAASVPGQQVAGKTGSVGAAGAYSPGDTDLWFSGFTPTVVGAIWEGFPQGVTYVPNGEGTSALPAELFSAILRQGLAGQPSASFPANDSLSAQAIDTPVITGLSGSYSASAGGVSLQWNTVSDTGAYYLVYRGAAGEQNLVYNTAIGHVTAPAYVDPLQRAGTYTYEVAAFDNATHSLVGESPVISVTIPAHTSSPAAGPGQGGTPTGPGNGAATGNPGSAGGSSVASGNPVGNAGAPGRTGPGKGHGNGHH